MLVSEPTPEQQEAVVTSESVITTEGEPEAATPEEQITTSFIAVPEDIVEGTTASIQVSGQTVDTQVVKLYKLFFKTTIQSMWS